MALLNRMQSSGPPNSVRIAALAAKAAMGLG